MTVLNAGLVGGVAKDFALADLPFLYDTPEQADAVMDGPFGNALLEQLPGAQPRRAGLLGARLPPAHQQPPRR